MRQLGRFARHGRGRERGAVLVEAAIVTPLITLLVFGLIEFGFAWKDKLTLASAARAGARAGTVAGLEERADFEILKAIEGSIASNDDVDRIVVYDASGPGSTVPGACKTAGAGISGQCNVYTGADLSMSWDAFAASGKQGHWPASSRQTDSQAPGGLGYVGVWVSSSYESLVGVVGSRTLSDYVVMRLEPTS